MKHLIIAVTGASGSILARRLIEYLTVEGHRLHILISDHGREVYRHELEEDFDEFLHNCGGNISFWENDNLFAPISSGTYSVDGMIIVPCSMATVGKIASGSGDSLICRAADVCLKEKRMLILSARESPLSEIHLRNLHALSRAGAQIVPPVPPFYTKSYSLTGMIDHITGKILKTAGIENPLCPEWGNAQ